MTRLATPPSVGLVQGLAPESTYTKTHGRKDTTALSLLMIWPHSLLHIQCSTAAATVEWWTRWESVPFNFSSPFHSWFSEYRCSVFIVSCLQGRGLHVPPLLSLSEASSFTVPALLLLPPELLSLTTTQASCLGFVITWNFLASTEVHWFDTFLQHCGFENPWFPWHGNHRASSRKRFYNGLFLLWPFSTEAWRKRTSNQEWIYRKEH